MRINVGGVVELVSLTMRPNITDTTFLGVRDVDQISFTMEGCFEDVNMPLPRARSCCKKLEDTENLLQENHLRCALGVFQTLWRIH